MQRGKKDFYNDVLRGRMKRAQVALEVHSLPIFLCLCRVSLEWIYNWMSVLKGLATSTGLPESCLFTSPLRQHGAPIFNDYGG